MAEVSFLPSANSRKRASASREEEVESYSATSTVYPLTPFKANKVMMHFWLHFWLIALDRYPAIYEISPVTEERVDFQAIPQQTQKPVLHFRNLFTKKIC